MTSHHTDHLFVADDEDNFIGLLTEHEIVTKAFFNNNKLMGEILVKEMMNTQLPVAEATSTIEDCMRLMKQFNVRYLPVFDELHFMGIISASDILHEAVMHRTNIFDKEDKNVSAEYS
jgi:CBS domain-containing protein